MSLAETTVQELQAARIRIHELEQELAETHHQFRQMFEHIPIAVAILDANMHYLNANPMWLERNGLEGRDLIGHSHYEIFPFIEEARKIIHRRCLAGEIIEGERDSYYRPDGTIGWMSWQIRPWYRLDQTIGGLLMYASILTPQVEAETKLRHSEARYQSLVENSPDFIMVVDRDSRIQFVNRVIPGMTVDHVIGKSAFDFVSPEFVEVARVGQQAVLNGQPFAHYESPASGPHDTPLWYETRVLPVHEDDKIVGLTLIATIITERKLIEQALHESESNARSLLKLARQLETATTTRDVLRLVSAEISQRIGYRYAWFYLFQPDDEYAELISGMGEIFDGNTDYITRLKIRGDGMMEAILASNGPVVIENAETDPRTDKAIVAELKNRTIVNIPVTRSDRRLGVLGTGSFGKEGIRVPDQAQLDYLTAIASQVAGVIERIRFMEARQRAEAALLVSETHFKEAQRIAHIGNFDFDLQTQIGVWSDELYRIFGVEIGTSMTLEDYQNLLPPQEFQRVMAKVADAVEYHRPYEIEHHVILRDGTRKTVFVIARPMLDHTGTVTRIFGIVQDITERKQIELALSDSQRFLKQVLDTIPVRVFWKDRDQNYAGGNQLYARDAGFDSMEAIVGKSDFDFFQRVDAERYRADDLEVFTTGLPRIRYEEPQTLDDGSLRWLLTSKFPLLNSAGEIIGVLGTYDDITARKQAELAIRQSEERYRTLIQNLPGVNLSLFDRDLRIIYTDGSELERIGMSKALVEGKLLRDILPPEAYTQVASSLDQAFAGEILTFEVPWGDYYFQTQYVPIRTPAERPGGASAGQIEHVMSLNINITERKQLELNLQQFMDQLRVLHEVTLELSAIPDLKAFYYRAIELGRSQLGFDRMAIFLLEENGTIIRGTVGVDDTGSIRDESAMRRPVHEDDRVMEIIRSRQRSKFWQDIELMDQWQAIGHGWSGMVTLWDGQTGIGWVATDNLLRREPLTPYHRELLSLYGNALGHLITRKRVEQATQAQRDFLQQIIDTMPGKVLVKDRVGRLLVINQGIADSLGMPPEAILGKTDRELGIAPELAALYEQSNQVALDREETVFSPEEFDEGHYYQTTRIPLKNQDGIYDRIVIVAFDITARKMIEAERELLIEELTTFRALVENASNGIVMTDLNGVVIYGNRAFHEMHGYDYSLREVIGIPLGGFQTLESSTHTSAYLDYMASTSQGQGMRGEARRQRKHGKTFDATYALFPIRNLQGEIINVGGIIDDITTRKQIEFEREYLLNQSERLYHLSILLAAIRDEDELLGILAGATMQDESGEVALNYIFHNDDGDPVEIELINQMDAQDQIITHLGERFAIEDYPFTGLLLRNPYETILIESTATDPRLDDEAREVFTRHGIDTVVIVPLYQSGRWTGVFMRAWVVPHVFTRYETDFYRALPGLVAPVASNLRLVKSLEQNVEELKVATAAAQESSRLKSEFLSTMSHELRTPLNAIEGFTSIMLGNMGIELNSQAYRMVERVSANSKRLLSLINDFLDLSRIEAGRMELIASRLNPVKLATNWKDQVAGIAGQKDLKLVLELDPALPDTLYGDEEAMTKITLNLLSNAIKFTHQGQVTLALKYHDPTWSIEVTDTGIGIPPHAREYIFDEFRQVDQSSRRQYGGTGLGLAIVQKLARAMGGTVAVKSEPEMGSTFTVTLPVQPTY